MEPLVIKYLHLLKENKQETTHPTLPLKRSGTSWAYTAFSEITQKMLATCIGH